MNYRSLLMLVIAACTLTISAQAQDDQLDDYTFDQSADQATRNPYFAVGGGYILNIFMPKLDELQNIATSLGIQAEIASPVFLSGGEIFTSFPLLPNTLPNLRIGFSGAGGSRTVTGKPADTAALRQFIYSHSMYAFELQYAWVPFRSFAVVPSANIGWATISLEASRSTGDRDYSNIFGFSDQNNTMNRMEATHFLLQPALNIEYSITPYLMVRAAGNYSLSFSPSSWKANGVTQVNNVPNDKINSNGFSGQIGIFLGIFNY